MIGVRRTAVERGVGGVRGDREVRREVVPPASQALPAGSSTMPPSASPCVPPITVEYTAAEPAGLSFVTKPSLPSGVVSKAPGVVGKSVEPVPPAT